MNIKSVGFSCGFVNAAVYKTLFKFLIWLDRGLPASSMTYWLDRSDFSGLKHVAMIQTRAQRRSTASRMSSWWPTRLTVSSSRSWWEIFNSCWPSIFSFSKFGTYCWRLSSSPDRDREEDITQRVSFSKSIKGLAYFNSIIVLMQTQRRWVNKRYLLWPEELLTEIFFTLLRIVLG